MLSSQYLSQLRPYSRGIVAENKAMSSRVIWAIPLEVTPLIAGKVGVERSDVTHEGTDASGRLYNVSVTSTQAIPCDWMPFGTNSVMPPDVRIGERVMIYRYADEDKYWWVPLGLDDDLRRLETQIWRYSDIPDGVSDEKPDATNSYIIEVSTHKGLITLRTSKRNEEPYLYTFQFNCKEGVVTLADDVGNYFEFDSSETKLTLKNADGTMVSLDKQDIIGFAPRDTIWECVRDFMLKVGRDLFINVERNVNWKVGGDYTNATTGAVSISGQKIDLSGESPSSFTAPVINLNGMVNVSKGLGVAGATVAKGGFTSEGESSFGGASTFNQKITANGISSSSPITGPTGTI